MKLICIGRNYTDHIKELDNEKPTDPVVFLKPDTAILLKKQPFFIPDFSNDMKLRFWLKSIKLVNTSIKNLHTNITMKLD